MTTIADTISRVRNVLKAVKEDPFLTDRFIYSMITKYAKMMIKRLDDQDKIKKFQSLFQVLPCVELVEVSRIEACCPGIKTNCIIKRTKEKVPTLLEGTYGPLFRSVTSIDGSVEMFKTYPATFTAMTGTSTFKYNKTKYFWYLDGYMYFPNIEWDAVRVEGLFDGDIAPYLCDTKEICEPIQNQTVNFPEYLFAEIEQMVIKEILTSGQVPSDGSDDKQNVLR